MSVSGTTGAGSSRSFSSDPFRDREGAPCNAENNEADHGPPKRLGIGDAQDLSAKSHGQVAENQKAYGARRRDGREQLFPWIAKCAGSGHNHCEGERRWSQAPENDRSAALLANFSLEIFEAPPACYFLNAGFPRFARDEVEQECAAGRTADGAQDIERIALMMARDQANHEKIVSERYKEKRRIQDAHHERPEIAKLENQCDELTNESSQAASLTRIMIIS